MSFPLACVEYGIVLSECGQTALGWIWGGKRVKHEDGRSLSLPSLTQEDLTLTTLTGYVPFSALLRAYSKYKVQYSTAHRVLRGRVTAVTHHSTPIYTYRGNRVTILIE
jgi:hypothetical protein